MNIVIENTKPHLTTFCSCKNENDSYLTTNTKYVIESFPDFLIVLIDMNYNNMVKLKKEIADLVEEELYLNLDLSYKLKGIILIPYLRNFISAVINPEGIFIKVDFKNYKTYIHDNLSNNGNIFELKENEVVYDFGIPYILIYKKL